jgi:hypothetical protein
MRVRPQDSQRLLDDSVCSTSKTTTALYESRWQWFGANGRNVFTTASLKYTSLNS